MKSQPADVRRFRSTRHISKWGIPVTEPSRSQNALCNGG